MSTTKIVVLVVVLVVCLGLLALVFAPATPAIVVASDDVNSNAAGVFGYTETLDVGSGIVLPLPPTNVAVTAAAGSVTLTFTEPATNATAPATTGFRIQIGKTADGVITSANLMKDYVVAPAGAGTLHTTAWNDGFDGFDVNAQYAIGVRTVAGHLESARVMASTIQPVGSAPSVVVSAATATTSGFTATWTQLTPAPLSFVATVATAAAPAVPVDVHTADGATLSHTFKDLPAGSYVVTVVGVYRNGVTTAASAPASATVAASATAAPAAPTGVAQFGSSVQLSFDGEPNNSRVSLTWTPATSGTTAVSYNVRVGATAYGPQRVLTGLTLKNTAADGTLYESIDGFSANSGYMYPISVQSVAANGAVSAYTTPINVTI